MLGTKIGPEYAFGYYMGEAFDEQVLLIKYGPGGQSLYQNFRPPSAGVPAGMTADQVGDQYRVLIGIVHDILNNLKYVLGSDPRISNQLGPSSSVVGSNLIFTFQRRHKRVGFRPVKIPTGMMLALVTTLQALAQDSQPVPLWPAAVPGALGTADKDIPTLTPFLGQGFGRK